MASFEQSVKLLRNNKEAIVGALQGNGFIPDSTPGNFRLSEAPRLIKTGAGLFDVSLAAVRTDGVVFYFTATEWNSLTNDERNLFNLRGFRVRAGGECFILSLGNLTASEGSSTKQMNLDTAYARAQAYTAFEGDVTGWKLPTRRQGWVLFRYRDAINNAIRETLGTDSFGLEKGSHWTLSVASNGQYNVQNLKGGEYSFVNKTANTHMCRPVLNLTKI